MASRSALLVIACLGAVACSPSQKARPGTQARWEEQLGWPKSSPAAGAGVATRRVAESAPRCLKDRVADPHSLREDVTRLEQGIGAVAVTGQWQNQDLSKLASPQAQFLKANAHWISTDGIDFASCTDLPCIFNKVYDINSTEPGWKAYYYYLATGYSISMRDYVPVTGGRWREAPDQALFDAPRSAHLFSNSELLSFRKLAALLPQTYRFMGSQRFHRVPEGPQVPDASWCKSGQLNVDGSCACAGGKAQENPDGTCNAIVKEGACKAANKNADGSCRVAKSSTCGDSWGGKSKGLFRIKRCIEEDNYAKHFFYDGDDRTLADNGIRGQFYVTMTHEMSHAWDRTQSNGLTPAGFLSQFSETEEWKALSGWHEETVVIPAASGVKGATGVIRSSWQPEPGREGFVRDYARTHPNEDLAETAAWVRFRPTLVSQRSPLKTEFLSKKLFGGRTYDPAGLTSYYIDAAATAVTPQLLEVVRGCLTQAQSSGGAAASAAIAGAAQLTLQSPLPEPFVACIEGDLNNRVSVAFDELRATEWEACDLFSEKEAELRAQVFERLSPDVSRLASENAESSPVIQAALQLRAALAAQVDPREAYIHCFRQAQPETCYQQAVGDAFDRTAQPLVTQLGDFITAEKTSYLAHHPFEHSQLRTRQFYGQVLAGIEPILAAVAQARWQGCMILPHPSPLPGLGTATSDPVVNPYSGGTHFVAAHLLNCVNSGYEADLVLARDAYLARFGLNVSDVEVQALIEGLLLPTYLEALKAKQEVAAREEDADRERRKPGMIEVLSAELARDQSWLTGTSTAQSASEQCAAVAGEAFNAYFSRVSAGEQLPTRFAAIEDIRSVWAHEACARVIASPVVTRELDLRVQKAWKDALAALEIAVNARARDKATDCIARKPSRSAKVSESVHGHRRQCLVAKQAWTMIESQALVDWEQSSEGRAFASTRKKDAVAYLGERRRALQNSAIKVMRARK